MAASRILVVEDEQDILELIAYNLAKEGYLVDRVETGEAALKAARSHPPDAIILDLMLPGLDGLEVCRRLKREASTQAVPILMLTAKTEEADVVTGLEVGADDYITKPFSPKVLVARLRTALRRARAGDAEPSSEEIIRIHGLEIDVPRHTARCDGAPVELSATEFAVLEVLARNAGWVFSRARIIDAVKGSDYPVTERSVDVQIVGLRRKLGLHGALIETVRGVGYRFRAE